MWINFTFVRNLLFGKRVAFLHIGKNAGTQITLLANRLQQTGCSSVRIVKMGHGVKLHDLPQDMPYFFSIRDPISRFKSGFLSRKRQGLPKHFSPWSASEALAFELFASANELAENLFEPSENGKNAVRAITSIQHTGMHQIDWFIKSGFLLERPPVWIIRQNCFEQDVLTLLSRLDLHVSVSELFAEVPVRAHSQNYDGIPELSIKAIANLKKWYERDFLFCELCEDWIASQST